MRKKIVLATTAGALTLTGLAFAVPAMAEEDPASTTTETSAEDRIRDALEDLVTDGSITQEQADEVATTLGDAGFGGHGWWHGGGDLSVVAETLGLSEDELRTALEADGASLASVAESQGVAVEDLVAALTAAVQERIAAAVEDGRLTQEQADERTADLETWITERVNATDADDDGWRGGRGGPWWGHDGDDD
ncbi:polyhydroxyalkanoate synthesis regulator phasin [Geodermatophilus bullaregiensis]|uniref:hypothetical protein n=1 Tax=Geodermatophilus bullaregiensis TaxID=1564160 RepID=UPI00195D7BF9|nr:hypothetical protein [Geodermatophilus bullaregiensis]MBM7804338.1 polyhydroxyalkanoate synthesis regulator phasin [Geodermatophilus bullaregiensis]